MTGSNGAVARSPGEGRRRNGRVAVLVAAAVVGAAQWASGAVYTGNGGTGFGGTLGNGSLNISDAGGNITFTFNPSGGFGGNDVVVYIDSVAGGFNDTSTFSDNGDGGRVAVSGFNSGNPSRTTATFPTGFGADYALEFENNVFTGLFGLVSGGNNSLNFVTGAAPVSGGPYTVTFPISDLGIAPGASFNFDASLISTTAYRSNETIGTSVTTPGSAGDAPNAGFAGSTVFSTSNSYTTTAVPEPASLGVLGLGALVVAGSSRRRR
jgi:hypothetical protein